MLRSRFAVCSTVLAVTLAAACAPAPPPAPDTAAMVAAADDLDQRFLAAFNAGDASAMATMYWDSPEAVSFPPDAMIMRGSEIAAGMDAMLGNMKAANARLAITESHQMPIGDAVVGWGLFTITMNGPDGAPMEIHGRYTDVKAERNGRWVYLIDHASAPMSPAAPAM